MSGGGLGWNWDEEKKEDGESEGGRAGDDGGLLPNRLHGHHLLDEVSTSFRTFEVEE